MKEDTKKNTSRHGINLELTDDEWDMFGELAYRRLVSRTEILRAFVSDLTGQSCDDDAHEKAAEYLESGTWERVRKGNYAKDNLHSD